MLGRFSRKFAVAVLAGVAGLVASGSARAGSVDLVYFDLGSQQLIDSGWTASWDDNFDGLIDISVDGYSDGAVFIEKFVNYTPDFINPQGGFIDPAVITFQQRQGVQSYASSIVLSDEQLVNNTGRDWDGFRMFLMGNATFDPTNSAGFSIDPFTISSFTPDNKEFDVTGGIVPDGSVWRPGAVAGALWINANPDQRGLGTFVLKEQPQAIPLPAAAWSGLGGLVGLALIGSRRKLRELVA